MLLSKQHVTLGTKPCLYTFRARCRFSLIACNMSLTVPLGLSHSILPGATEPACRKVVINGNILWTSKCCRTLRDIFTGFQHLKAQNAKQKPAGLLPVTESPLGRGSEVPSVNTMQVERCSPLGRNLVTALEAELNEVCD